MTDASFGAETRDDPSQEISILNSCSSCTQIVRTNVYIRMCVYIYIYIYTHKYIHTHTIYTHTRGRDSQERVLVAGRRRRAELLPRPTAAMSLGCYPANL